MAAQLISASWVLFFCGVTACVALLAISLAITARAQARSVQRDIAKLNKDLTAIKTGAVGMGRRIIAMEESHPQYQSSGALNSEGSRPYTEATHLLSLGLDKDEVASRCGLSRAEASLLDALRKKSN
ncbi:DUF2802 domain-containing protein [Gilvimarinus chinensis]|uniref:DUF2802 domain-containing protein n=1 Tax=Gilvimarinus chinensis TaxID=396005 RepID=UPI00036ED76F|nr:DUF2802 domain-containing protein [Gilvimarinus chinensis]